MIETIIGLLEGYMEYTDQNLTKDTFNSIIHLVADKYKVNITEEMWASFHHGFATIDSDNSTTISIDELEVVKQYMNLTEHEVRTPPGEEIIAWLRSEFAKDGNVTLIECIHGMLEWAVANGYVIPSKTWKKVTEGFHALDTNGDDMITENELEAFLNKPDPEEEE